MVKSVVPCETEVMVDWLASNVTDQLDSGEAASDALARLSLKSDQLLPRVDNSMLRTVANFARSAPATLVQRVELLSESILGW